jgi:AcrR family transcriptional regulator
MNASAQPVSRSDPATIIKEAALRLFAEHGIQGVTVREIAEAAGQKNHAAVGYHFGSKEELIRAVIVHGARLIDDLRNALLDAAEAKGGPRTVEDVMRILIQSSLPDASPPWSDCYNRFVVGLQLSHRTLFMDALEGRWNAGYLRCLDHVRRLLPDVSHPILNQRLIFMGAAFGGVLASREQELADRTRAHRMWDDPATLDHLARSLGAMLRQTKA